MTFDLEIAISKTAKLKGGLAILLAAEGAEPAGRDIADPESVSSKAADVMAFKAGRFSALDVLAPHGAPVDKIIVMGLGKAEELDDGIWLKAGGATAGKFGKFEQITIFVDAPGADNDPAFIAEFVLGLKLRSYRFDKYKTRKKDDEDKKDEPAKVKVTIVTEAAAAVKKHMETANAVHDGVVLARNLVNEPANVLGPLEFAAAAKALEKLGVEVELLDEKQMTKLGMGALMAVARGSVRPPRMAIMKWNGGKKGDAPLAFIGKGVVFDTGGISIKPAGGMEDMKGDMGGAAAVTGLMHTLAARKAKVNAVGILGLVENMPDGDAYRPGDVVTSMSGQTIEVINTDAEGRLVLCDALYYCNDRFKPQLMINLATLTGAIMVALGSHHAGLFSNNDELSAQLTAAGLATGDLLWRMPLGKEYDKLIDSKIADMKNTGGRYGGAITAAQFLKRYVGETPWAHIDLAGTAMGAPSSEINRSWGSGYGVRLLNAFVAENFEG